MIFNKIQRMCTEFNQVYTLRATVNRRLQRGHNKSPSSQISKLIFIGEALFPLKNSVLRTHCKNYQRVSATSKKITSLVK